MRVIISRKGFDTLNGAMPSPILPNKQLISFPIPAQNDSVKYSDLSLSPSVNYFSLISSLQLQKKKDIISNSATCHLDPDIYPTILKRPKNWKPLFGQIGAAQTHLRDNSIKKDDLFLFFGWFRHTTLRDGLVRFDKTKTYSLHVLFGYFQIDQMITNQSHFENWMCYHPHIKNKSRFQNKNNCVYVAKDHLTWNEDLPGASPFIEFNDSLVLTKKDKNGKYLSRSKWFFD